LSLFLCYCHANCVLFSSSRTLAQVTGDRLSVMTFFIRKYTATNVSIEFKFILNVNLALISNTNFVRYHQYHRGAANTCIACPTNTILSPLQLPSYEQARARQEKTLPSIPSRHCVKILRSLRNANESFD